MIPDTFVPTAAIRHAVEGHEADILTALGINGSGKRKHIRCPYPDHIDKHPSWRWDATKRRAYCTCAPPHSIFDVIAKTKGIDFEAAKIAAAEIIGRSDLIRTKMRKRGPSPGDQTATLQHSEGCTLAAYASTKQLKADFLHSLGITQGRYFGAPALKIPYRDATGAESAIRYRVALDGPDKFRFRGGDKALLYGLDRIAAAREVGAITICEGESDCHTLWQAGFPGIGLPGASNWKEERDAKHFEGFNTIYVVIEPDKGGHAVLDWLAKSKIRDRVRLVPLSGFKDPNALYLDDPIRFAERWRAALKTAVLWRDEAERERRVARDAAWTACRDLARSPDILSRLVQTVRACGLVGEEGTVKLIYLAVMSRLLMRIVSIVVKGPSSGGKSFIVEMVLRFFPPEAFYVLTAMSEHALAYGQEPLAHRMIVLYEAEGLTGDIGTYLVRSLLSENRICYETVEKTKDGLKARRIEREGPTGLITTTTAVGLHPENETRLLSVNVTDTTEQTKEIMLAQANQQGRIDSFDRAPWHALQQAIALEPAQVVIPFAKEIAELIPAVAVRLRRDFPTVLALIQAHALLHQVNRERNTDGAVIATFDDYSAVRDLVADLVSHGVGATVSDTLRETVDATAELQVHARSEGVSITALGQKLNLDKSSTSRRVKEAIKKGYLKNREEKRGQPARLVLGDPLPGEVVVLPTPETLGAKCGAVAASQQGMEAPSQVVHEEEMAWTV